MSKTSPRILMIATSHGTLGDTGRATGVWIEELTTPFHAFEDAGAVVEVASIRGGAIPIDPSSLKATGDPSAAVERYRRDTALQHQLAHSLPIERVDWLRYDAIVLPGGHGTMWDLPESTVLAEGLSRAFAAGRVLAALCHGPAGLLNVRSADGTPVVAGRRVTAFTNREEDAAGLTAVVPFLLETRLRELGAHFECGSNFAPFALADRRLVTGQNPASSQAVADLVMAELRVSETLAA